MSFFKMKSGSKSNTTWNVCLWFYNINFRDALEHDEYNWMHGCFVFCREHVVLLAFSWKRRQFGEKEMKAEPEPGWGRGHSPGRGISEASPPFATSQRDDYPRCVVDSLAFPATWQKSSRGIFKSISLILCTIQPNLLVEMTGHRASLAVVTYCHSDARRHK